MHQPVQDFASVGGKICGVGFESVVWFGSGRRGLRVHAVWGEMRRVSEDRAEGSVWFASMIVAF